MLMWAGACECVVCVCETEREHDTDKCVYDDDTDKLTQINWNRHYILMSFY